VYHDIITVDGCSVVLQKYRVTARKMQGKKKLLFQSHWKGILLRFLFPAYNQVIHEPCEPFKSMPLHSEAIARFVHGYELGSRVIQFKV